MKRDLVSQENLFWFQSRGRQNCIALGKVENSPLAISSIQRETAHSAWQEAPSQELPGSCTASIITFSDSYLPVSLYASKRLLHTLAPIFMIQDDLFLFRFWTGSKKSLLWSEATRLPGSRKLAAVLECSFSAWCPQLVLKWQALSKYCLCGWMCGWTCYLFLWRVTGKKCHSVRKLSTSLKSIN